MGIRGYSTGNLRLDKKFKQYAKEIIASGKEWGVYFLTQATNTAESESEAHFCADTLRSLNTAKMTLGVYCDSEYSNLFHNGRGDKVDKSRRTAYINAFCDMIQRLGYPSGVYCSESWAKTMINRNAINYPFWIAKYGKNNGAQHEAPSIPYVMWQFTSKGTVPGIKGNVDISVAKSVVKEENVQSFIDYSSVFNADYYADNNKDLLAAFGHDRTALFNHFLNFGMKEGRRASVEFNPAAYKARYKDLRSAFGDDWKQYYLHYILSGKKEGRRGA